MAEDVERPRDPKIVERLNELYDFARRAPAETLRFRRLMLGEQFPLIQGDVGDVRKEMSPEEACGWVRRKVDELAERDVEVRFTRVHPSFVYEGRDLDHGWAISLVMPMDHGELEDSPGPRQGVETTRVYYLLGKVCIGLGKAIREELGWPATGHHPRMTEDGAGAIVHMAAALRAGQGRHAKNGLMVTRRWGPRVRIATVTTDMELIADEEMEDFGVEGFCAKCSKCVRNCPSRAVVGRKRLVRGVEKYVIEREHCIPFFAATDGCSVCIKVCPFNKPDGELEPFLHRLRKD